MTSIDGGDERGIDPANGPGLLEQLDSEGAVVMRSLRLDAIEPDPDQPREYFDPDELQELAESLNSEGLLQEPAVYPVAVDDLGQPVRYRLLFGERRWRAARLAGWTDMRCKVLPSNKNEDLIGRLRRIDQQAKENSVRAALSAVEEAKSIQLKLEVLRKLKPSSTVTALVEQIAQERKTSASTVWRLLDLLNAPPALRTAILHRKITSRDLAFVLATFWSGLVKRHQEDSKGRRDMNFYKTVKAWAEKQGLELCSETLNRYANANFLDPKMVKASVKAAERIEQSAEEEFERAVRRAIEQAWTVKDARRFLESQRGSKGLEVRHTPVLFERSKAQGRLRLTVYLSRMGDPGIATADTRRELAKILQELLAAVDSGGAVETSGAS